MNDIEKLEERISQLTELIKTRTETMSDKELTRLFYRFMCVLCVHTNKENCIKWVIKWNEKDSAREVLTMAKTKDYKYIVHFTEYNVESPTKATVYKVVKQGIVTFTDETEYCYDPKQEKYWRTDEEHYEAIKGIVGDCKNVKIKIPAHAASLISCFQRHGYEVEIYKGVI